jgi:hypothetical protein
VGQGISQAFTDRGYTVQGYDIQDSAEHNLYKGSVMTEVVEQASRQGLLILNSTVRQIEYLNRAWLLMRSQPHSQLIVIGSASTRWPQWAEFTGVDQGYIAQKLTLEAMVRQHQRWQLEHQCRTPRLTLVRPGLVEGLPAQHIPGAKLSAVDLGHCIVNIVEQPVGILDITITA